MQNRDMTLKRIFIITNFVVEIPSAVFDQLSSLKPQYALISMIMSFTILLISLIDLAHLGMKERVKLMRRCFIPWFYSPYPNYKPLGSFTDIVGLICGIFQCVITTISYASLSQISISVWPLIFAFGVLCSRFPRSNYECKKSVHEGVEIHPNNPSEGTLHGLNDSERMLHEIYISELSTTSSELAQTLKQVENQKSELFKISLKINTIIVKLLEQNAVIDSKREIAEIPNKQQDEMEREQQIAKSEREIAENFGQRGDIAEIDRSKLEMKSRRDRQIILELVELGRLVLKYLRRDLPNIAAEQVQPEKELRIIMKEKKVMRRNIIK